MKDKISVIIPVYNVEQYLERCLNSVVSQTYQNLEIILINDGSQDNSRSICEEYAKLDSRIIVLNQNNCGSSIARNAGIEISTGEIISFIDSDDYIESSMFEKMVQIMQKHNLEVVEIEINDRTNNNSFDNKLIIENPSEATLRILKNTSFSVWRRIYKKELINDMRFIPGIIHQDVFFTVDLLKRVSKIGYLRSPFYNYNLDNVSIIRSKYTIQKVETGIRATEYIIGNTINTTKIQNAVNKYVVSYYTEHYFLISRNIQVDPNRIYRTKLRKTIFKSLNKENIRLRSMLVVFLPTRVMEVLSTANFNFKQKLKLIFS